MIKEFQYGINELAKNHDDPHWWRNRIEQRLIRPFHLNVYPKRTGSIRVMEEPWDNLIILDACRWDLFEEVVDTSKYDNYTTVKSLGSGTGEWTQQNFQDGEFGDTVYITSNPHTSRIAGDVFHHIEECWLDDFDEDIGTVHPEPIVEAAYEAYENFPNKRLIIHFMQPHHPFVRREATHYGGWKKDRAGNSNETDEWERPIHVWDALEMGSIDRKTVWEAYADNLRYVMGEVNKLVDSLPNRTVITSDHGNFLGERVFPVPVRLFGHTNGVRHPAVNRVPWATISGEDREITRGNVKKLERKSNRVHERLKQLGYIDVD